MSVVPTIADFRPTRSQISPTTTWPKTSTTLFSRFSCEWKTKLTADEQGVTDSRGDTRDVVLLVKDFLRHQDVSVFSWVNRTEDRSHENRIEYCRQVVLVPIGDQRESTR